MASRANVRRTKRSATRAAPAWPWLGITWSLSSAGSHAKQALLRSWWEAGTYAALLATAAAMRLWDLGSRAMHHDESLHAYYSWNLANGLGYQHNPMMHGPFQMEATAAVFSLLGDSEITARVLYAVVGTVLVVLPFFFRDRLGRLGALIVSAMLVFSPAMLYFSRFARNDIIMAVWALGLVICMWRYLDEGKHRYLYMAATLLALSFATKENAYIITGTLGLYLGIRAVSEVWPTVRPRIAVGEVSPPATMFRIASGIWSSLWAATGPPKASRSIDFLVLMATLSLPLWSASVSIFQHTPLLSWSNLVLASPVGEPAPIGAPVGGGLVVAAYVIISLFVVAAYFGLKWNRFVWWRSALVFYAILLVLYTTFFTSPSGVGSGLWQSLGYWLVQQGEARGGQPWYYYFVITSVYELLALLFAIVGAVYYLRRKDPFGRFLVYWAVITFVLYTIASEKMPWLMVGVTLPLIVLAGTFLGEVIGRIQWRRLVAGEGLLVMVGVPLLLASLYTLAFFNADAGKAFDVLIMIVSALVAVGLVALGYILARRLGYPSLATFAAVPVAVILLMLGLRAGWNATYRNGDIPVEMIVYTQTSPDLPRLAALVKESGAATGDPKGFPVAIDGTSGFHWPWLWYLRNHTNIGYTSYDGDVSPNPPDSPIVLVHSSNKSSMDPVLEEGYTEGQRLKHRWWFPENYRGLTLGTFLRSFIDRGAWQRAKDYFLHRKLGHALGSEDAYLYFSKDYPGDFDPSS